MAWFKVADMAEFKDKNVIQIDVEDELIGLYKINDEYFALSDICSHAEAYLSEGERDGDCIVCPLHGAKFDIKTGQNRALPAVTPVDKYHVKVEGNDIFVEIPD